MQDKTATSAMSSEEELVFDKLDESLQNKTPKFVYVVTILSAVGGFLFGYDTGVVSGAMVFIREEFKLSLFWQELIVSATIATAWLFALIGGWLTDTFGRKPVILLASSIFVVGSILLGLSNGKVMLLIGRLIVGAGIGLASMTVPLYIAEIAPTEARGRLTVFNNLCITGGQFCASCVDGAFSYKPSVGWRFMLGLGAVPAFIQFIGFLKMPESPRWLISKGQYDRALSVLRRTRSPSSNVEEEYDSIKFNYLETEREREARGSMPIIMQVLKTGPLRRALIIGCALQLFQQVAGINTVMYYSATIIIMSGVGNKSQAVWLSAATSAMNFFCTFIGVYFVEKVGRRMLLLCSMIGVIASLILLAIGFQLAANNSPSITLNEQITDMSCNSYLTCNSCIGDKNCGFCSQDDGHETSCLPTLPNFASDHSLEGSCNSTNLPSSDTWAFNWCPSKYSWIMFVGMLLYLFFFAPGLGPMPWTINSEIYPLWARSTCYSAATSVNWAFNLLVSMTFLTLMEAITPYGAFWLYASVTVIGVIIFYIFLPETRGKNLEELEMIFSKPFCSSVPIDESQMIQYVHIRGLNRDCNGEVESPDDS